MKFIDILKSKVKFRKPNLFKPRDTSDKNLISLYVSKIVQTEQKICFPVIFEYSSKKDKLKNNIPNLIVQLNVFLDENEMLRVKSKFDGFKSASRNTFPLLLPKNSLLTVILCS